MGGLGNQLFQYGLGKALAHIGHTALYVDLIHFKAGGLRSYELDSFYSSLIVHKPSLVDSVGIKVSSALDLLRSRQARRMKPLFLGIAREIGGEFNQEFLNVGSQATLRGYFQSWRYLEPVKELLRADLRQIKYPTSWFLQKSTELNDLGPFVGVHIRLGDYTSDANFGHLDEEYFSRALAKVATLENFRHVVVFSDDINRVKTLPLWNRLDGVRMTYVDAPADSRPIESLNLMSLSHHLVISNSTFSWWAAWLGDHPDRKVIAPSPWLINTPFDEENLCPPHWLTLRTDKAAERAE